MAQLFQRGFMFLFIRFLTCLTQFVVLNYAEEEATEAVAEPKNAAEKLPTVFIPILARNKAHALPTFFGYLDKLNYPKDRISIWIRTDHNQDNTTYVLYEWASKVQDLYHRMDFNYSLEPTEYEGEKGPYDWSHDRFVHLIKLREKSLEEARFQWADYYFTVDVDNFLQNPDVLMQLINQNKTLVAPMLTSQTMYSNFWGGVTEKGYYKRTLDYVLMLRRNKTGLFKVPMIHSTYLIHLRNRESDQLTFYADLEYVEKGGDIDDMLTFQYSAKTAGVPMYILNSHVFGKLIGPGEPSDSVYDESQKIVYMRIESMIELFDGPMAVSEHISNKFPIPSKLGFDEVYMISLARRPLRRQRMVSIFKELGIDATIFDAVDGKALTTSDIRELGIDMLEGYKDPWSTRTLTKGEIGCFLSHYYIWQEVVEKGYDKVLIMEDDLRFEMKFIAKMNFLRQEMKQKKWDWDLIYIGRKILRANQEKYLNGSQVLVMPSYSYWTLSYMISQSGARKLLDQKPLHRMVPVDEYLPIMFDKHPSNEWSSHFSPRNLLAFSVNPLFVFPTHYTGEPNYTSDTETSNIWEETTEEKEEDKEEDTVEKSKTDKESSNGTNPVSTLEEEESQNLKSIPSVQSSDEAVPDRTEHTEL